MVASPSSGRQERRAPLVVAAGGQARRMGGGKGQRLLDGISLLDRALCYAVAVSGDVGVAMPADRVEDLPPGVHRLIDQVGIDSQRGEGPIGALAAAMNFAAKIGAERVAMIGCDMPFLPGNLLDRLGGALDNDDAGVALAVSGGRWHPLAAMWRVIPEGLCHYRATGSRAMMGFAEWVGYVSVEWDVAPVDPFFNINTPDDLAQAERQMADFQAMISGTR